MRYVPASLLLAALACQTSEPQEITLATFSIVCRDPKTGDFAVGVTTQPQNVRRLCPFAKAGVGAVATQAQVNVSLGDKGLALISQGKTPQQAVEQCIKEDRGGQNRQLAMIDAKNPPFAFTGTGCQQFAGHIVGKDYATQGNILVSRKTLEEVAKTFETTPGSLAGRVIAALRSGKAAGGDKRGHNSCAVIVASSRSPDKLLIDLSEDNHPDPVERVREKFLKECSDWFQVGDREFGPGDSGGDVLQLEEGLKALGHFKGDPDKTFDDATKEALYAFLKKSKLKEKDRVDLEAAKAFLKAVDSLPKKQK